MSSEALTAESFLAFYPQFAGVFPEAVLTEYIALANARFDEFLEDAPEARRLYTAHKLTLYAKTFPVSGGEGEGATASYSALASAGDGSKITGKKVENVSVTYSSGSSSSSSTALEDLGETIYGKQLLSLLKLFSRPRYVP